MRDLDWGIKIEGSRLRDQDLRHRDWGIKIEESRLRDQDWGIKIEWSRLRNQDWGIKIEGLRLRNQDSVIKIAGSRLRDRRLRDQDFYCLKFLYILIASYCPITLFVLFSLVTYNVYCLLFAIKQIQLSITQLRRLCTAERVKISFYKYWMIYHGGNRIFLLLLYSSSRQNNLLMDMFTLLMSDAVFRKITVCSV